MCSVEVLVVEDINQFLNVIQQCVVSPLDLCVILLFFKLMSLFFFVYEFEQNNILILDACENVSVVLFMSVIVGVQSNATLNRTLI